MKTTIKSGLVLVLSIITFFSCSKDDDSGSIRTELVGTWTGILNDADDGPSYIIVTYNSDGTGTLQEDLETLGFNWEATSNTVTLSFIDTEDIVILTYSLSDNNNTGTFTDEEGDISTLYRYTD
tara:strand:+ start:262 stop:633 length:372 start_codon:yes stop_codon:yes gene_type:complete